MPIKIPDNLPAREQLEKEGLFVMRECDAMRQDIRPLNIGLLNLMPLKKKTEVQLARLIGATPLQIELTLLTTSSYQSRNESQDYLKDFYKSWNDIKDQKFDGFIITGAPVEKMEFEAVTYWQELTDILDWTITNVHSTLNICWGAQAALYHFYKVPKYLLPEKAFGVFYHRTLNRTNHLLRGFSDELRIPVSRFTETKLVDIQKIPHIKPLIMSDKTGLCLMEDEKLRHVYMLNHVEYDATTLRDEYQRDMTNEENIPFPHGYFPQDNLDNEPPNVWRSHAHLLFANWINQAYQSVPFDQNFIGNEKE